MTMALDIQQLCVFSDAQRLVHDIALQIPAGTSLTLLGESGSGKSLLAQAIMGNLPAPLQCSGTVRIGAHQSDARLQKARHSLWGRQIGLLPQEPWLALDPTMTVERQIAETYALVSHPPADSQNDTLRAAKLQARSLAQSALQGLGLQTAAKKYPHMISGGMAQRVAFLATHAAGARMMIIDEPTKGLDSDRRDEVVQLLKTALAEGIGLLAITHDVALARSLGGRIAVMLNGRIVEQGSADEILDRPQHEYSRRLFAADPANWPSYQRRKTDAANPEVVVRIENVAKRFGKQQLFSDVGAVIRKAELVSISGPSGSGKTTLGNIVLGLIKPDQGRIERSSGLSRIAFQKIYQDPGAAFAPSISIRRSLQDVVELHKLDWQVVSALLARLRLQPALLDRLPSQVSGGELQRFALARVLILKPVLIFADEPTSRLDPITQQATLELLAEHARECQCAVLLVTHDREIAKHLADRELSLQ